MTTDGHDAALRERMTAADIKEVTTPEGEWEAVADLWRSEIHQLATDYLALLDELEAKDRELERLRAALEQAIDGMESMRNTIGHNGLGDYFSDKYGHDADIAIARAALSTDREEQP